MKVDAGKIVELVRKMTPAGAPRDICTTSWTT